MLPKFLSKVHPKYATPHLAIIAFSAIAFVLAVSGGFRQLVVLATITLLITYAGVVLALIKFRLKSGKAYPAGFMLPGGLLIPIVTLIILGWFLFQSKINELIAIGIFLAVLSVIYAVKIFFKKRI